MKFKNFVYYKNRKLYCYDKSEYVNFSKVIEYIRDGYQIGVFNTGEDFHQEKALLRGNRYIIQNFAKKIDTFSDSTVIPNSCSIISFCSAALRPKKGGEYVCRATMF